VNVYVKGQFLTLEIKDSMIDYFTLKNLNAECQSLFESKELTAISNLMTETQTTPKKELILRKGEAAILEDLEITMDCLSIIKSLKIQNKNGFQITEACNKEDIGCDYDTVNKRLTLTNNCYTLPTDASILLEVRLPFLFVENSTMKNILRPLHFSTRVLSSLAFNSLAITATPRYNTLCGEYDLTIKFNSRYSLSTQILIGLFPYVTAGSSFTFYSCTSHTNFVKNYMDSEKCFYNPSTTLSASTNLQITSTIVRFTDYDKLGFFMYAHSFGDSYTQEQDAIMTFDPIRTSTGQITIQGGFMTIMEPSLYTATFNVPCTSSGNTIYIITPFSGTQGECYISNCRIFNNNIEITLANQAYGTKEIKFTLYGPTNKNGLSTPIVLTVKDDNGRNVFETIWRLASDYPLHPAPFTSVHLSANKAEVKLRSIYTFLVVLKHYIPNQGKIELEFNPSMTFYPDLTCNIDGKSEACVTNGKLITIGPLEYVSAGTTLEINVGEILNPYDTGDYPGFFVRVRNNINDLLAESENLAITLDLQNYIASTMSIATYTTILGRMRLNFTMIPRDFSKGYTDVAYFDLVLPSSSLDCELPFTVSDNLEKLGDYKYKPIGTSTAPLGVLMYCKETNVKFNKFDFIITDTGTNDRITGKNTVVVKSGTIPSLDDFTLYCSNDYPRFKTTCQLTFVRTTKEPIETILLSSELFGPVYSLKLPNACGVEVKGSEATCTYEGGVILLTFPIPLTNRAFTVINLEYINPEASEKNNKKFSFRTFNSIFMTTDSLIDKADNLIPVTVKCDYPCNTCVGSLTSCTSCVVGEDTNYFAQTTEYTCVTTCADGTYPDYETRVCKSNHA
jgi:hypothetical protein